MELTVDIKQHKLHNHKEFKTTTSVDGTTHTHRFPVYRHNGTTMLEGEMIVNGESGEAVINVYDICHNPYTPFYNKEYGNFSPMLDRVNNAIDLELRRLGMR